jgi:branched-chain amino acid aminotransferase
MAFPENGKIWMSGGFVEWADAAIPVASHTIHYGSCVFEGARCYDTPNGSVCFRLDAHVRRLQRSGRIYRMEYPLDLNGWMEAALETIRVNNLKACYIRPLMYRGYGSLGVAPAASPVDAAILVWEWGTYGGEDALEHGVDMQFSSWTRIAPNTLPAMAKCAANYANSALARMEAVGGGYSEGLVLDVAGHVSEGAAQNVFVVNDGILYTPPLGASILGGVTRDTVITLAGDLGLSVTEAMLPREAFYIADEVFGVGTAAEIAPVRSIDMITIGNGKRGPITTVLQQAFFDVINGNVPDTRGWLTRV